MKKITIKLLSLLVPLLIITTIVTYAALHDTGFVDVSANAWYAPAVAYCVNNQLISGISPSTFSPNAATSRAMLATILYRRAGSPDNVNNIAPFLDVETNSWYTKAVSWAKDNNVLTGYSNGNFLPDDPITREQLATILWRYAGTTSAGNNYSQFSDHGKIASYALNAVYWARIHAVISGKTNNVFDPQGIATRAETAAILRRYFESDTIWSNDSQPEQPSEGIRVSIIIDGKAFSLKLHNNASAKAIAAQMPFTLDMRDFSRQEKVAPLPFDLPSANSETPPSINEGEIYLWSGNQLVLFYTSFSSNAYSYVPIGYIEDVDGLTQALGSGSAVITFKVWE